MLKLIIVMDIILIIKIREKFSSHLISCNFILKNFYLHQLYIMRFLSALHSKIYCIDIQKKFIILTTF